MSLEARIESLENAVVALTEVLKASTSGAAVTVATKPTTKADTKTEEKGEKPARASRSTKAADKAPTVKALQDFAQKFLDEAEADEDNYADRRAEIKRLAGEYKVNRLTECEEGDRAAIIDALKTFADDNPVKEAEDDAGI